MIKRSDFIAAGVIVPIEQQSAAELRRTVIRLACAGSFEADDAHERARARLAELQEEPDAA